MTGTVRQAALSQGEVCRELCFAVICCDRVSDIESKRFVSSRRPHGSHITYSATLSASAETIDTAKEGVLEQVWLLLGGCKKRSPMYQFSLHCVDGTTEHRVSSDPRTSRAI